MVRALLTKQGHWEARCHIEGWRCTLWPFNTEEEALREGGQRVREEYAWRKRHRHKLVNPSSPNPRFGECYRG